MRCNHVFTANKPRITSVAARIRSSGSVLHASPARTAKAANATTNRFTDPSQKPLGISPAGSRSAHARSTAQLWCTGKDSNLRTSLGGTDLQSVGFNHSPTCAETAKLLLPTGSTYFPDSPLQELLTRGVNLQASQQHRKNRNRASTLAHENHYTSEKFLMECVWKTCCAAIPLPLLCRIIVLGAGEGI